jgi:hypothetical protein
MILAATMSILMASAQPAEAAPLRVTGAHFFAIDTRGAEPAVTESRVIPHRPQTSCFAWLLQVEPREGTVNVREELRLPARAPNWGQAPEMTVHADGAGATFQLTDDIADGEVMNQWCLSPGDPTGAHSIRVFQGDRLLHQFDFSVEPEASKP